MRTIVDCRHIFDIQGIVPKALFGMLALVLFCGLEQESLAIESNKDLTLNDDSGAPPSITWDVTGYPNAPGIRFNQASGDIEYRDDNSSTWIALDSLENDPAPDAFSFADQTGVNLAELIKSNAVTLSGFSGTVLAVCNAGCTGIYRNGAWAGTTAGFRVGDTIEIQQISSSSSTTTTTASVTIGATTSSTWSVTTGAASINTPDAFSFPDQSNNRLNSTISSSPVTLSGSFTGPLTATCGAGCTNIAKNGIWAGATTLAGFYPGSTIQIQQTTSSNTATPTTATVTVGTTVSGTWTLTTAVTSDPCDGTPAIGTMCADETIYAGLTPDGNVKMYITPCDAGMTWNSGGSTCEGARSSFAWNDGSTNYAVTGVASAISGEANTTALAGLTTTESPYAAAIHCATLSANGYGDWYLPAPDELSVIYIISNGGTTNGFGGLRYWSSRESGSVNALYVYFATGSEGGNQKYNTNFIRCARK